MNSILSIEDLECFSKKTFNKVDPSKWTCLIPAAGKGSRLAYSKPKILYPILGKPILNHLTLLFKKYCNRFIVIASPKGAKEIQKRIDCFYNSNKFHIVIQEEPKGMAHAIWQARDCTVTPFTMVVWGDQICLRDKTISDTLIYHQSDPANVLTFPTVIKENPYIHFQRNNNGKILKVLQKRENEINSKIGENDCGFFCFSTNTLFSVLKSGLKTVESVGIETKEINLLQLFPKFEITNHHVNTLRIAQEEECMGINTKEEGIMVESILRKRG